MDDKVRVLVVGLGHMGLSHAKAYLKLDGFEIVGLCARSVHGRSDLPAELAEIPRFDDYAAALEELKPDAVSINTWSDTHADYAVRAFRAGAHVFVEKPIAETVEDAERVVAAAKAANRKLVIGYILRHHPSWMKLVELARTLGRPLAMRMNLNQQSIGEAWTWHKDLMRSLSPIVDCGVHYVDIMCLITGAKPVRVHGIGARLTDEVAPGMYNYGQLQVVFDDGSVGWYEAGWGPMISEVAYFVKDIIGPKGSVSITMAEQGAATAEGAGETASSNMDTHTKTSAIRLHHADLRADGTLARPDEVLNMADEPGHDELCEREQAFFLDAIRNDTDLTNHMADAVNSLRIVLAADPSIREKRVVEL
ncbi:MAG TPA: Gfo/Idh/MocA family oxidoreductase [Alphaproteobacteria bacterium]|nr:Gfo/Idh/MocA family oxidoreductase [Alphaproteobacteria bacterium]